MLTSQPTAELSPLDVIMLEAMFDSKFCDQECYRPEVCDKFCQVCKTLLIPKGGTA
jgi:hypothetical protein